MDHVITQYNKKLYAPPLIETCHEGAKEVVYASCYIVITFRKQAFIFCIAVVLGFYNGFGSGNRSANERTARNLSFTQLQTR